MYFSILSRILTMVILTYVPLTTATQTKNNCVRMFLKIPNERHTDCFNIKGINFEEINKRFTKFRIKKNNLRKYTKSIKIVTEAGRNTIFCITELHFKVDLSRVNCLEKCDQYQWYNYSKQIKECICYESNNYCEKNIPITTFIQTSPEKQQTTYSPTARLTLSTGKQQTIYSPTSKLTSSITMAQYMPTSTLASRIRGSGSISSEEAKDIQVTVFGVGFGGVLCGILLTVLVYKIHKRTPWTRKRKQGVSNAMYGVEQANEHLIYSEITEQDNIATASFGKEPPSTIKRAALPIHKSESQDKFYNHLNENEPDDKIDNYQHTKPISNPPPSLVTKQQCCFPENVYHHLNENQQKDNMIHDNRVYEETEIHKQTDNLYYQAHNNAQKDRQTDKQVFFSNSAVEEKTSRVPEKEENSYFVLESYNNNEKQ